MSEIDRRSFNRWLAAGVLAGVGAVKAPAVFAQGTPRARVVIIGGGAGGATVAHLIKKNSPDIDVTLIEPKTVYTTCFFSNQYIAGFRSLQSLQFTYDGLKKVGVNVVTDIATNVDAERKIVFLKEAEAVAYDKLVLSPGIDLKYEAIDGYTAEVAKVMPHAWLAGEQSTILHRRLLDMPMGGTVVITAPENPYRCPAGPYERATLIAHYLKYQKPGSKVIILDAKSTFTKMELFEAAWQGEYKGIVEWVPGDKHGGIAKVIPNEMTVVTANGDNVKADLVNVIPPQKASDIAAKAGCTSGDWCPIVPDSFASRQVKDVFVLGDAAVARKMPKSASSANSQAQTVANVITAQLAGHKIFPPRYRNTCWSMISADNSIKAGASYVAGPEFVEQKTSFKSSVDEDAGVRAANYKESLDWYAGITKEMFATE